MTKKYATVSNDQRRMLVSLIYEGGQSIRQAAIASKIYYPTAKAINKIYLAEKRIDKKQHRFRRIAPKSKGFKGQQGDKETISYATMLKPIREELDFGLEIYESLDEAMVDVTEERVNDSRLQSMPFDHYKITKISDATSSQSLEDSLKNKTDADGDSNALLRAPTQENSAPVSRVSLASRKKEPCQTLASCS